jgi:hypothetical protein
MFVVVQEEEEINSLRNLQSFPSPKQNASISLAYDIGSVSLFFSLVTCACHSLFSISGM